MRTITLGFEDYTVIRTYRGEDSVDSITLLLENKAGNTMWRSVPLDWWKNNTQTTIMIDGELASQYV